jgi:hypothetical protein
VTRNLEDVTWPRAGQLGQLVRRSTIGIALGWFGAIGGGRGVAFVQRSRRKSNRWQEKEREKERENRISLDIDIWEIPMQLQKWCMYRRVEVLWFWPWEFLQELKRIQKGGCPNDVKTDPSGLVLSRVILTDEKRGTCNQSFVINL